MVENLLGEETPQIYVACGRGPRSSLRVLRHGIAVSERAVRYGHIECLVNNSQLPSWCTKWRLVG